MESPLPQKRRSRSGCTECRQRRRKCDEGKPACSGCLRTGRECEYAFRLSWGGRPFGKSRFGECLKKDPSLVRVPVKAESGQRAFVYGSAPGDEKSVSPRVGDGSYRGINRAAGDTLLTCDTGEPADEQADDEARKIPRRIEFDMRAHDPDIPLDEMIAITYANQLIRNPNELSWLSSAQRFLLDHFISCTTMSLSCHPIIQQDFCEVLIPTSFQTPHLLAAVLAFAATHRLALGLPQSESQLDFLKCVSLQQLQAALDQQPSRQLSDAVVATTLTLCTTDIISDTRTPGSWRLHLQGTAAIISDHLQRIRESSDELSSSESLLWRWYLSIETLSLLCGNLAISPTPTSRTALQMRRIINDNEIDDLAGFSASLIPIFGDINLLAMESIQQQKEQSPPLPQETNSTVSLPNDRIRSRCYRIISDVRGMLASHEPRFRPLVDASLSSLHKVDFVALDETFHHVALLHLYRRVLNLPSSSTLVQSSVQLIISRLSTMHFLREPCPGVAVLQPVFTAGCEACGAVERDDIRGILGRIEWRYGMGNVKGVRGFLEELWVMRDERGDTEGLMRWDEVMVAMGLDILPY